MRKIHFWGAAIAAAALTCSAWGATTYTYDDLGRLSIVTYDNGMQVTYSYDAAGNRAAVTTASGTNQPPVANPDYINVSVNTPYKFDPRTNDTDADRDTLTITSVGTPSDGTAAFTGTSVTYTPNNNFVGSDSFTYQITDGHNNYAKATIYPTVAGCGQPPAPQNDSISTLHATPDPFDPRTNDSDPCGYALSITQTTTPTHGSVAIVNNSTELKYSPAANYDGSDSFNYTVSDGHGQSASATVTATDQGTDNPPVAVNDNLSTIPKNVYPTGSKCNPQSILPSNNVSPMWNDSDPDKDTISIVSVTQPSKGSAFNNGDGSVTYTYGSYVTGNLSTTDSFTYKITDGYGGYATATVNVSINVQKQLCGN